jgi:hypothetical protein
MDNSKYDYEELTKLSALGRLRLLFGSFGTTFLFVVLITFLTLQYSSMKFKIELRLHYIPLMRLIARFARYWAS